MSENTRVVITGGGTGGHVYPGIAIANALKGLHPEIEITFVGVKNRIESKIVPREGYPLKTIHVQYLSRKLSLNTITFFFSLLVGLVQSFVFLRKYKPKIVIGTGGFVSGPVVYAATLLGIPTLIQEQNSYPGITTKILAPRVDRIHLAFEEATKYLKNVKNKEKFRLTGNPVRLSEKKIERREALKKFNLDENKKTLLLFGGSQGASALNETMAKTIIHLPENVQLIWQTGESDFVNTKTAIAGDNHRVYLQPFIYNMADAYAAADLALCRSGAITIAEIVQMGVPALFVPYPFAAEGHQEKNARVLAEADAAALIVQQDLTPEILRKKIEELIFDESKLAAMRKNLKKFYHKNAAQEIAKSALELMK